jgi:hypothetical protein
MIQLASSGDQTFNMCNITPQTKLLNQSDWNLLEMMLDTTMPGKYLVVIQGSMINNANTCTATNRPFFTCTDASGEVRIPYAFWKMVISRGTAQGGWKMWLWFYDKAQTTHDPNAQPFIDPRNGPIQTIKQALVGLDVLTRIENEMGLLFPDYLKKPGVIQSNCTELGCNTTFVGGINDIIVGLNEDTNNLVNMVTKDVLYTPISGGKWIDCVGHIVTLDSFDKTNYL